MTTTISAAFDSGNITVKHQDGNHFKLAIRKDHQSDFNQWFHFRVACPPGTTVTLDIEGLKDSAYPGGWPAYQARVSEDRKTWTQAPTTYDAAVGTLQITYTIERGVAAFAYFAPYSFERHQDLVAAAAAAPGVVHQEIGQSIQGRAIDCLRLGDGAKQLWIYARQHPGESMAEWFMEGLIDTLTDPSHSHARALRALTTLSLVPNLNPDGSVMGHLRTNAAGVNLNRVWDAPSAETSPEILAVRDAMDATGVDYAIDVHGDEAIPGVFLAGFEGIPDLDPDLQAEFDAFKAALDAQTHDFQTAQGYPVARPGAANLTMSTNQVAHRYQCVSMTLEMPFKDHDAHPDPKVGWSPDRCKQLATDFVVVLSHHIGRRVS